MVTSILVTEIRLNRAYIINRRSIILSSIGKTSYPYCLYIRSLDLSNLEELLDDNIFRDNIAERFFADEMEVFRKRPADMYTLRSSPKVDKAAILNLVGDSISRFVGESAIAHGGSVAVEEISGTIEKSALSRWVADLSRLKYIRLWDGGVLDSNVADIIAARCLAFDSLSIYSCDGPQADAKLASFLGSLRPNTLRFLQVISHNEIDGETFLALTHHAGSLKDLRIDGLQASAMNALSLLRPCTAIQTLELRDCGALVDLESTENDNLREIIAWLTSCRQLKIISLKSFANGPAILAPVCLENNIRLEGLTLHNYPLAGNQDFHRALTQQTSLELLDITANPEDSFRDDIDVLVTSLCCLTNLRYLNLLDTSDYFNTQNVQAIANSLTKVLLIYSPPFFQPVTDGFKSSKTSPSPDTASTTESGPPSRSCMASAASASTP